MKRSSFNVACRATLGFVLVLTCSRQASAQLATLDSAGTVGWYTSTAIGSDGLGLITYCPESGGALKVAHCSDTNCGSASISVIEAAPGSGLYTSVAIGVDGLPLISYYNWQTGDLKVAHCSDLLCSNASITILDSAGDVGGFTSAAIGADGLGIVSYFDWTNGDLKVAHCADVACTTATLAVVDSIGIVGTDTAIAIGVDGLPLISYHDLGNKDLKVAHCSDVRCTAATVSTLDAVGEVGWYTSTATGVDGRALISYYAPDTGDLKVAHCDNPVCTSAAVATLDTLGDVGLYSSVTIGADGLGLISYWDLSQGDLRVAHCADVSCTTAFLNTVDHHGNVGAYTSAATNTDGFGLIGYFDASNGDLKIAHCPDALCSIVRLALYDAHRDGLADVLSRNHNGLLRVLTSTGTGFTAAAWSDGFTAWGYDVYFADVMGDGRADVVARKRDTGDVEVFASTGSGFAYRPGTGPGGVWSYGWGTSYELSLADVNGDGRADLIGRLLRNGDLYVFPSTGTSFDSTGGLWSYGWTSGYQLDFGDVNGDGKADVVAQYRGPVSGLVGDVYVAVSTGGRFVFVGRWAYGFTGGYEIHIADVDGDRRADLVARYAGSNASIQGNVYVMRSTGTSFSWAGNESPWIAGGAWASYELLVRDVDGDGRADLVGRSASVFGGTLEVALSTGARFTSTGYWFNGPEVDITNDIR